MKSTMVWNSRILLTGLLLSGAAALAVPLTVYVDVNAAAGGTGGAADPYQTIGAGVAAIIANAGVNQFEGTVKVADGVYRATANGGLENFGANGITISKYMTIKGGYAGSGDWTEPTRVLRSTDIDLTGANTRAFYQAGGPTHQYNGSLIDGFTIRNGNVTGNGGAISMDTDYGDCMSVANSAFINNRASGQGGAVWLAGSYGPASVSKSTFSGNQAGTDGGGVFISNSGNYGQGVFDSVLVGNRAATGGGVYFNGASNAGGAPKAERDLFLSNTATAMGGALFTPDSVGQSPLFINMSTFLSNSAPSGAAIGGAAYWQGAYTIRNSLIAKNTGGGYAVNVSGYRVENMLSLDMAYVTVADNLGGGVYVYRNGGTDFGMKILDSIIANNGATGIYYYKGGVGGPAATINYSDVYGQTVNLSGDALLGDLTGTIFTDPAFMDALNNNYRLLLGSGAIDSGINIAGITTDLQGWWRPLGAGFEMGAFESPEPAALSLLLFAGCWLLRRRADR